ncbi:uncharacterized protein LOC129984805 isoform X2 [Argiope bruennichi]|uniref:uncharacterized protein LOC129984805 isoform X2 n=1 Tax=Argiope bruennichi TaxID=94029 RepID=UPI002494F150|nr:uncharacterized protein LOC129984805 isoform X2 [Argiope bruennichi]
MLSEIFNSYFFFLMIFIFLKDATSDHIPDFNDCGATNIYDCSHLYPAKLIEKAGNNPTKEDLEVICPHLLIFTLCRDTYVQNCAHPSVVHQFEIKELQLYIEICNPNSAIRTKYLEHQSCFKYLDTDGYELECYKAAQKAYKNHISEQNTSIKPHSNHEACLELAYTYWCAGIEVMKECGEEAYRTFLKIENMRPLSDVLRLYCSQINFELEFLSGFFPSVENAKNDMLQMIRSNDADYQTV